MNRSTPTSTRPSAPRSRLPVSKPESNYRGIEQRHWVKIFVAGLFFSAYGSLLFLSVRPEIPNIFTGPEFAPYWVFLGLFTITAGLIVRTWGSR